MTIDRLLLGWVAAYGFVTGIVLGALVLVMTFHVTHARWAAVVMPLLLRVVAATPALILLFVPIALGATRLYPPHPWNALPFFLGRAALYLAAWTTLAVALRRIDDPARLRALSAAGLVVVAFTGSFAAFDWLMALEAGWVSTAYGLVRLSGGLMGAIAIACVLAAIERPPMHAAHVHALGRLLLMAVILWAYLAFFQLMLVWIADVPRESAFFGTRARGALRAVDWLLVVGHFGVPFLLLLSRPLKRHAVPLAVVAAWLVLMDAVECAWLVLPARGDVALHPLDAAPFVLESTVAVLWARFRGGVRRAPPAVVAEALRYESP